TPEEVNWTALPQKGRPKILKDPIRMTEDAKESLNILLVIGRMVRVLIKRSRVIELDRCAIDLHLNARRSQRRHVLRIKIGNGPRIKRDRILSPVASAHQQPVLQKIEFDFKSLIAIWNRRCSQADRRYVKRHIPPMIGLRSENQSRFADDLG